MRPPESPGKDDLTAWLDAHKNEVRRKMVLVGKAAVLGVTFAAPHKRFDDAEGAQPLRSGESDTAELSRSHPAAARKAERQPDQ